MKICLVSGVFPPQTGGPATYAERFLEELRARGHEIVVIAYGQPSHAGEVHRVNESMHPLLKLLTASRLAARHARHSDLVYALDPFMAGIPALAGAWLAHKPLLLRLVGNFAWENSVRLGWIDKGSGIEEFQRQRYGFRTELLRWLQEFVARHARLVIVPSSYNKRLWQAWGIPEGRFRVIANAVGVPPAGVSRQALGLPAGKKIVLAVARLLPFKQIDKVIECLAVHHINAKLGVIGEGEQENELKRLAQRLQVDALFLGRLPHEKVMQYLSACDAFVLYSTYEGQSHLLLEAMAAGAPILASDLEPNRELIQDGVNGLLVDPQDTTQLAQKFSLLLGDSALARQLTVEAKKTASQHSWSRLMEKTLKVFNEALVEK